MGVTNSRVMESNGDGGSEDDEIVLTGSKLENVVNFS